MKVVSKICSIAILLASAGAWAQASRTGYSDFTSGNTSGYKFAVGYQVLSTIGPGNAGGLHAMAELTPNGWAGLEFGFDNAFDDFVIAPDFRYVLKTMGSSDLFVDGSFAFLKRSVGNASATGFQLSTLLGFSYGLTSFLRASFAYGLHFGFGDLYPKHIGLTENAWHGTFGLHWYF